MRDVHKHEYPAEAVVRLLDFYKGADWSTGTGPEVSGPAMSLLLAMTGRSASLDDLSGDGVDTLRSRM
jgi:hypothetical protein